MIVDTSALIAVTYREPAYELIREALLTEQGLLPSPAYVEYRRVVTLRGARPHPAADALMAALIPATLRVHSFSAEDADQASRANFDHGAGNGRGGTLNLIDLMIYAVATRLDLPILCTGRDFAGTDAKIHPASRRD